MVQVQAGGSFDVDYEVVGPGDKIILDGQKERQGDFVFTAGDTGEYRFCFNNQMSTFAEKFVDFEIAVCSFPYFRCCSVLTLFPRLRTKPEPRYLLSRVPLQNRHLLWRNPSSSFQASFRQSQEIRSTSVRERTGISALCGVPRGGYSTLVLSRV
jgi:hypothetical protein